MRSQSGSQAMRFSILSARSTGRVLCAALLVGVAACDSHVGRIAGINGPTTATGGTGGGTGTGADTARVATIAVAPSSASMTVGATQTFSATARNASGTTISA